MRPWVRIANAVLALATLVLVALHGASAALLLVGLGAPAPAQLPRLLVVCLVAHAVLGAYLTFDSLRSSAASGASYPRLNARLWASRVSGLAIVLLVVAHLVQFLPTGGPSLRVFGWVQLALSLMLVAALAVHISLGVRPLAIALGLPAPRSRALDVAIAATLVLALCGVAFCVYLWRWSVV